jgi:hypothetical protein
MAWLILVGLAVEVIAVFVLNKPKLEGAFTIGSAALIWIGVWGELHFEKRAKIAGDGIVAEANKSAREAEARAAEANQKRKKQTAKRRRLGLNWQDSKYLDAIYSLDIVMPFRSDWRRTLRPDSIQDSPEEMAKWRISLGTCSHA